MADSKITALTAITTVNPATYPLVIVDTSDTSMAITGTTKKVTTNQLLGSGGTATLASATITGDLTVDTSTLKVDSANNRVGIGTASPASALDVYGETRVRSGNQLRVYRADNAFYSSIEDAGGGAGLIVNNFNGDGFLLKVASNNVYQVNSSYVQTWYDGAGGTRMTLNSTGLGVGASPNHKLQAVGGYVASGRLGSASTGDIGGLLMYCSTDNGGRRSWGLKAESGLTGVLGFWVSSANNTEPFSGSQVMSLDASGRLGVGVVPASNVRTHFKGSSTSTDFINQCINNSDKLAFGIRNDGLLITGSLADVATLPSSPYNLTTGSAANVFVDSQGIFYRSTSSLKYKTDIADSTRGLADVLKLRPVTYKAKNSGDTVFGGLIAEEVDAAGLTEFVQYAPDNTPDAIHYGNMVSLLVAAIKELTARVQTLETR